MPGLPPPGNLVLVIVEPRCSRTTVSDTPNLLKPFTETVTQEGERSWRKCGNWPTQVFEKAIKGRFSMFSEWVCFKIKFYNSINNGHLLITFLPSPCLRRVGSRRNTLQFLRPTLGDSQTHALGTKNPPHSTSDLSSSRI